MLYKLFDPNIIVVKTIQLFLAAAFCLAASVACVASPPAISVVNPAPGTIGALTQITVVFSEVVTNVAATDLLVAGNPAIQIEGSGTTYTFTLEQQPGYGTVVVEWDPGHGITDTDTPPSRFDEAAAGSKWQYNLVDGTAPVIVGLTPAAGVGVRQLTQVEVRFSESVLGVDAADLLVNGIPAGGLTTLGSGWYLFTFAQPSNGPVQMAWSATSGIRDLAQPANAFAGGAWNYSLDPNLGLPAIRINEFVAANLSGLADENAEQEDWIEIHNYGTAPVNLNGYALTDDEDDPGKWTFPSTNLAPGQFLVVFASAKDRKAPAAGQRMHTNFKLNPSGGYLALFNAESPRTAITEFAPEYPEQRNNYSYGYDSGGVLRYFSVPTPGAANGNSLVSGTVPSPHFNVERGFFESPFTLLLNSSVAGAVIRYTTDGSEPTASNGATYSGSLTISNTTALRAAAFKTNMLPSVSVTHTYLFLDQVLRQSTNQPGYPNTFGSQNSTVLPADYEMDPEIVTNALYKNIIKDALKALPVISIVINREDMFSTNANNGIYTHSLNRGPQWEKPCSMEFILPDGSTGFQINAGIQMQGNAAREPLKQPKHPMRVVFKGDYGPSRLNYKMFPDSPVESFDTLILRADFNFSWLHWDGNQRLRGQRTRDAFMKDSMRALGGLASHNRYTHLYINGLYWGIYDPSERPDGAFAAAYLGGEKEDYDVVNEPIVNGNTAVDGDLVAYNAMRAINNLQNNAQYDLMKQTLDVPQFCDYMLLHFYVGHEDWGFDKNYYAVRRRGPGNQFKYLPWDGENILGTDVNRNRVTDRSVPSGVHTQLLVNAEYRLDFADRAHRALFNNGALTPAAVSNRWMARAKQVELPIVAESARWGDYRRDNHVYQTGPYVLYTRDDQWRTEQTRLLNTYFPQRTAVLLNQLRGDGLYPQVSAPSFNQHGGYVPRGFTLTMSASNTIYFTLDGSDPRVYGTGAVSPSALTYSGPITLNNPVVVKARALFGTTWSALNEATFTVDALGSPLRITEIMYNPVGGDAYEFLELQNVSPVAVNIGYHIIDGINYVFPPNTVLQPGQVILLGSAASPANWAARYPAATAFGRFDGRLDNGGEKLAIRDAAGRLLWSVDYDDEDGWPLGADGRGASLEIIDAFGDPDDPANWRASATANGTPGTITTPPAPSTSIVINEIMADNGVLPNAAGQRPDWIELHNRGAQSVNLANWSLSDDSNPRRFVFPATNVPPGGYVFIWLDPAGSSSNAWQALFGLNRNGQALFLYDSATNLVDAIGFGLQLTNYSIGRVGGEWQLTQPTPGAANAAAAVAPVGNLVLNEWLANAPPGEDTWIELHNRSATAPVPLRGIYLGTGDALHQLNALSFIAPGGYVQLRADLGVGAQHLDFTLSPAGGLIVLSSPSGAELDRVTYGPQAQGVSQGRFPDGTSSVTSFPSTASPAASNYLLASYNGPFLNEVLAINRAAATNTAGHTADFVELRNTNAASFDLSGLRLSTAPNNASQWVFPAGTTIPAQGHLVVWFDDELPATTNSGAFLNTGRSLDGESDEVWLFNAVGQPVDSVSFGFQIADLPLGRSGSNWVLLTAATPGADNAPASPLGTAASLRINEWMASPVTGGDWFEIYNGSGLPVALSGLYLADTPSVQGLTQFEMAPLSFIGPQGFVKCIADADRSQGRHHVNFSLDGEGEVLRITSPVLGVIDTVSFGAQSPGVPEGRLPDGADNIVSFPGAATPAESNYLPLPGVVINEVLTHTDTPLEDAIELYNPTPQGIDLSGWFLSDSADDFRKFRIPDGTFLPGGGYRVFYAAQLNHGGPGSFTLDSAGGDQVLLSEADAAGNLSGYRAAVRFGASANGVSLGRHPSCNSTDFVAMNTRTFGQDDPATPAQFRSGAGLFNAYPKVGPVVINEIMYHPPDIGTNDNTQDEFIELHNLSAAPVNLFDPAFPANTWRVRGGVSLSLPPGVTLPAGGFALLVNFDPAANPILLSSFRANYLVPAGVPIFGPYSGKLDNGGEALELVRPDIPQAGTGFVPYLLVDRVEYGDSAPWPVSGDGDGPSLQRRIAADFGNDAANWIAAGPTAGRANPAQPAQGPSITVQPVSRAVPSGSRVVFHISVCGNRPFSYQWKLNGGDIPGATNAGYVLESAQAGNAGVYSVLVANSAGSVLSVPATLSFAEPPVITAQPQPQIAAGGAEAVFTVNATGTGPLSYQWRRNGIPLPGATSALLSLTNLRAGDDGYYSVLVMNPAGSVASAAARLTVLTPPNITLQPQSLVVSPGSNVTFSVAATGVGTVRYQWQFNGANLPNATNATLVLNNVQLANEGDYRAIVTDDVTSGPSQIARLTVKVAPVIVVGPRGLTNVAGTTFTLTVTANGSMPMGVEWRRGALKLTNYLQTGTNFSFTVVNAQTNDSGLYRIVLTNSGNTAPGVTATAQVLLQAPPVITNPPVNQVVAPGATSAFSLGASGSALFYRWQFEGTDIPGATNATLTITNAQPANQGTYQVIATNFVGAVTASAILTVETPVILLQNVERLANGDARMTLSGASNRSYAIEASSNLTNWTILGTLTYTNGQMPFVDNTAAGATNRFYRARLLP